MKTLGLILLVLFVLSAVYLFGGLVWMICLGLLSHIFNAPNLAISYWPAVLVGVIFSIICGGITAVAKRT